MHAVGLQLGKGVNPHNQQQLSALDGQCPCRLRGLTVIADQHSDGDAAQRRQFCRRWMGVRADGSIGQHPPRPRCTPPSNEHNATITPRTNRRSQRFVERTIMRWPSALQKSKAHQKQADHPQCRSHSPPEWRECQIISAANYDMHPSEGPLSPKPSLPEVPCGTYI